MKEHIVPLRESTYEVSWERRVLLYALILTLLSFAGCVTLSVLEILSFYPQKIFLPPELQKAGQVQPTAPAPGLHPLALLPDTIDEFVTNARHAVPGYEGYMAEAIYEPEAEELSKVTPINTYVKVTFFERAWDAEKTVKDSLIERYPEGHQILDLNGQRASAGYEQNQKSFLVAWSNGSYAFEIDTSFVSTVPGTKGTILYDTGMKVASVVQKLSAETLAGKK